MNFPSRPMRLKISYSFNDTTYLARSSSPTNVVVAEGLGMVDLAQCLETVCNSSPDLLSDRLDYAVYSTDFAEPDHPSLGHGLLSSMFPFNPRSSPNQSQDGTSVVGMVSQSSSPFFAQEILEVRMLFRSINKQLPDSRSDRMDSEKLESTHLPSSSAGAGRQFAIASSPPRTLNAISQSIPDLLTDDDEGSSSKDTIGNSSSYRARELTSASSPIQSPSQTSPESAGPAGTSPASGSAHTSKSSAICANCSTNKSCTWRLLDIDGKSVQLCNACGLYYVKHRAMRPDTFWGKIRKRPTSIKRVRSLIEAGEGGEESIAATLSAAVDRKRARADEASYKSLSSESEKSAPTPSSSSNRPTRAAPSKTDYLPHPRRPLGDVRATKSSSVSVPSYAQSTPISGPHRAPSHRVTRTSPIGKSSVTLSPLKLHVPGSSPLKRYRTDIDMENKENIDPQQLDDNGKALIDPKHKDEIDALFNTPHKPLPTDLTLASGSPSRWLTKLMGSIRSDKSAGKEADTGALRGFLESPSKNRSPKGRTDPLYTDIMSELGLDLSLNLESTATVVSSDLPSSPPSFFYLYDDK